MSSATRNHVEGMALLLVAVFADFWVMLRKMPTLGAYSAGTGRPLPEGVRCFISANNVVFSWVFPIFLMIVIPIVVLAVKRRRLPALLANGVASLVLGWLAIILVILGLVATAGTVLLPKS